MTLDACLPEALRGPSTAITPLAGGLSGAAVYRVVARGQAYVLKITGEDVPRELWRMRVDIQQRAGEAGLAPCVIYRDEARRAVTSEHVEHRRFAPRLQGPATRDAAIRQLGEAIRAVHDLPLPAGAMARDPRDVVAPVTARLAAFAIPRFARTALADVLAETPPPGGSLVTSHNDMNPGNLVLDGARLLFLDWDSAGPGDPLFDLATVAVFFRLDDGSASSLLAAYGGAAPSTLPERFGYARRLVAALCATMFFDLARQAGHAGADVAVEDVPTLAAVHGLIGSGVLSPGSADGAWAFALALARALTTPPG